MQATHAMLRAHPELATRFTESDLSPYLSMAHAPEPDLFIRTGGEQRISNFLIWQLAYTELFFTETYWPDFDHRTLDEAIASYRQRERRFGRTSEQVREARRDPQRDPVRGPLRETLREQVRDVSREQVHAVVREQVRETARAYPAAKPAGAAKPRVDA
jgi:hypothetical protein